MSFLDLNKLKEMAEDDDSDYELCFTNKNCVIERVEILDAMKQRLKLNLAVNGCDDETIEITADELEEHLLIFKDVTEDMPELLT